MNKINYIKERPEDYHCDCKYCKDLFRGELRKEDGTYYSSRKREGYSSLEKEMKHLCPGHWQGYKFIIEKYTNEYDVVLDPFSGTGTALVEAGKLSRIGTGIELEFFKILKANTEGWPSRIIEGDAREKIEGIEDKSIDLIVTGPPYNQGADGPERKSGFGLRDDSFDYSKNYPNFAWLKDKEYYSEFEKLFKKLINKLKKGGHFALIIKDTIRDKKAYLLHYHLGKILEDLGLTPEAVWIHYHWPPTLMMNTYPKRFPEVKIPKYQTMLIFEKKQ